MKVIQELTISEFTAWSGAIETQNKIIEANKENEFDALIEELFPDGITETTLNDLLWFDDEMIFESLGIEEEEEEEEDTDIIEEFKNNMPCDNTGFCAGTSCKNYINCK